MSRKAFLVWRLTGATLGVVTWPFVLPLGTAGVPLSRWLAYEGWAAVLGWFSWASMGALVEALLAGGVARLVTLLAAFTGTVVGSLLLLLIKIPVFDEPWAFLEPALVTFPLAFGAAAIRIAALTVVEDLQPWRLQPRGRSKGIRLLLSVVLLLLAILLMGWMVKTFFWHQLPN